MGGASGLAWPSIGLWSKNANGSPALADSAKPSYIDLPPYGVEAPGGRLDVVGHRLDHLVGCAGLHHPVEHVADGAGHPEEGDAARGRRDLAELLHGGGPARRTRRGGGEVRIVGHATSSRSITRGAWSDGCLPLRALRSISDQRTRSANDGDPSTRSMRMPMPLWKFPAR